MAPLNPSYAMTLASTSFTTNSTQWYYEPITWSNVANPFSATTFNEWSWVSGSALTCPESGWYFYNIWLEYTVPDPYFSFGIDVNGEKAFGGAAGGVGLTGLAGLASSTNLSGIGYFDKNDVVTFGICSSAINASLGVTGNNPIYLQMQSVQGSPGVTGIQGPTGPFGGPPGPAGNQGFQGPTGTFPTYGDTISVGLGAGASSQSQYSVAVGYNTGQLAQGGTAVAIGPMAGNSGQGSYTVAIGANSGQVSQGGCSVAVGRLAGNQNQSTNAVAVGCEAGEFYQATGSVSIGYLAGNSGQATRAIAIGEQSGYTGQGQYAIALGYRAGYVGQAAYSIVMNASSSALTPGSTGLYISPVRYTTTPTTFGLSYDPSTSEVNYNPLPSYRLSLKCGSFTTDATLWNFATVVWTSTGSPFSATVFNDWGWVSGSTLTVPATGWYNYCIFVSYATTDPMFNFGMNVNGVTKFGPAASAIGGTGISGGSSNTFSGMDYFDQGDVISFGVCASVTSDTMGISNTNPIFLTFVRMS